MSTRSSVRRGVLVLLALLGIVVMHALPLQPVTAHEARPAAASMDAHHMTPQAGMEHGPAGPIGLAQAPMGGAPEAPVRPEPHAQHLLSPCTAVLPGSHTLPSRPATIAVAAHAVFAGPAEAAATVRALPAAHAPPDLQLLCISRT